MSNIVRFAVVQTAWTGDIQSMVEKNVKYADQAANQGTHNQCDNHMHTGQTEHQHDADRGNYCIHHYNLIARTTIKTP